MNMFAVGAEGGAAFQSFENQILVPRSRAADVDPPDPLSSSTAIPNLTECATTLGLICKACVLHCEKGASPDNGHR